MDDNNGDFSPPDHFTGSGLAAGHMRFKNQLPWNSLPVGAIIVIYNAADRDVNIPADDPFDWLNNDCVYILPSNHPSIEYCTTSPLVSTCTSRTDYSTCIYGTAGGWATVGLANSGDAIQVRDPSFNLIHGIVYGKSASVSGCTTTPNMVGNSLAPLITTLAMSGTSASVVNSSDLDYFNPTKWVVQNANLATPGVANNVQNENYISNIVRGGCTCNRILLVQNKPTLLQNNKINVKLVGTVLNINTKNNQNIYI